MHGKLTLTLGGEQRRLFINNYSRAELGKMYGLDPLNAAIQISEEIAGGDHVRTLSRIVYSAIVGNYNAMDQDCPITRSEVAQWVAEMSEEDMNSVWLCWKETIDIPEIIPVKKDETPAKKK